MEKEDRSRHFNRERRGGGEGERERGKIGAIVGGRREFKRASLWIVWFPSRVSVLSRCTRFNASGLFRNSVAAVSPTTNRPSLLSSFPFFVLHQRQGKPVQRNKRKRGECVGFLIRRRSWLPWSKREKERESDLLLWKGSIFDERLIRVDEEEILCLDVQVGKISVRLEFYSENGRELGEWMLFEEDFVLRVLVIWMPIFRMSV